MMRFKWINIWMICLLLVGHSMIVSAQFQDKEERLAYLELAGDSLIQLYMPKQDVGVVSESYLQENLEYALRAFAESPWFHSVPYSIFLNDILPYSSIG